MKICILVISLSVSIFGFSQTFTTVSRNQNLCIVNGMGFGNCTNVDRVSTTPIIDIIKKTKTEVVFINGILKFITSTQIFFQCNWDRPSYEWTINGVIIRTLTSKTIQPIQPGCYKVRYSNSGCWSDASLGEYFLGTGLKLPSGPNVSPEYIFGGKLLREGIENEEIQSQVIFMYDKNQNVISLSIQDLLFKELRLEVYDINGVKLSDEVFTTEKNSSEKISLKDGIYFYRLFIDNEYFNSYKVYVEK